MYDDLTLWHGVVSRFVSNTAFIEDGRVYVKTAAGIQQIPLFDPATVIAMMNFNPHLMEQVSQAWKFDGDRIEREFTIAVFEQYMDDEARRSQFAFFDAATGGQITAAGQEALTRLITALFGDDKTVTFKPFDLDALRETEMAIIAQQQAESKIPGTFQYELFAALNK